MKDKDSQEGYIKLMTDDKLATQRIYRALAGLLINPENTQMQDAVKETLLFTLASMESRAVDIENSNLLRKIHEQRLISVTADHTTTKENAIKIGNTSFKEKINDLKQSYSQISNNHGTESSSIPTTGSSPPPQTATTIQDPNLKQELEDIRRAIIVLNNEYTTRYPMDESTCYGIISSPSTIRRT